MLKSQGPYRQSQMSPKHNDVPPVHQYIIRKNVLQKTKGAKVQQAVNMWCQKSGWLSQIFEKLIFQYRSVNCAVSNVEGLKLKITARKNFKK